MVLRLGYIIESVCFGLESSIVWCLFNLQLYWSSEAARAGVTAPKFIYWFHRLGWCAATLCMIASVDPEGAHLIYPHMLAAVLCNGAGGILLLCCALFAYSTVELLQHHLRPMTEILLAVQRGLIGFALLCVCTNVSGSVLTYALNRQLYWDVVVVVPFLACLWANLCISTYSYITLRALLLQFIEMQAALQRKKLAKQQQQSNKLQARSAAAAAATAAAALPQPAGAAAAPAPAAVGPSGPVSPSQAHIAVPPAAAGFAVATSGAALSSTPPVLTTAQPHGTGGAVSPGFSTAPTTPNAPIRELGADATRAPTAAIAAARLRSSAAAAAAGSGGGSTPGGDGHHRVASPAIVEPPSTGSEQVSATTVVVVSPSTGAAIDIGAVQHGMKVLGLFNVFLLCCSVTATLTYGYQVIDDLTDHERVAWRPRESYEWIHSLGTMSGYAATAIIVWYSWTQRLPLAARIAGEAAQKQKLAAAAAAAAAAGTGTAGAPPAVLRAVAAGFVAPNEALFVHRQQPQQLQHLQHSAAAAQAAAAMNGHQLRAGGSGGLHHTQPAFLYGGEPPPLPPPQLITVTVAPVRRHPLGLDSTGMATGAAVDPNDAGLGDEHHHPPLVVPSVVVSGDTLGGGATNGGGYVPRVVAQRMPLPAGRTDYTAAGRLFAPHLIAGEEAEASNLPPGYHPLHHPQASYLGGGGIASPDPASVGWRTPPAVNRGVRPAPISTVAGGSTAGTFASAGGVVASSRFPRGVVPLLLNPHHQQYVPHLVIDDGSARGTGTAGGGGGAGGTATGTGMGGGVPGNVTTNGGHHTIAANGLALPSPPPLVATNGGASGGKSGGGVSSMHQASSPQPTQQQQMGSNSSTPATAQPLQTTRAVMAAATGGGQFGTSTPVDVVLLDTSPPPVVGPSSVSPVPAVAASAIAGSAAATGTVFALDSNRRHTPQAVSPHHQLQLMATPPAAAMLVTIAANPAVVAAAVASANAAAAAAAANHASPSAHMIVSRTSDDNQNENSELAATPQPLSGGGGSGRVRVPVPPNNSVLRSPVPDPLIVTSPSVGGVLITANSPPAAALTGTAAAGTSAGAGAPRGRLPHFPSNAHSLATPSHELVVADD